MNTPTDLMLFALLLALVAIFVSNAAGGIASAGGIYILVALAIGIIAGGSSIIRDFQEE